MLTQHSLLQRWGVLLERRPAQASTKNHPGCHLQQRSCAKAALCAVDGLAACAIGAPKIVAGGSIAGPARLLRGSRSCDFSYQPFSGCRRRCM